MKVKNLLANASELLGLEAECALLEQDGEDLLNNEEIKKLFNLSKLAIREICSNYLPISSEEKIKVENGSFSLANLKNFIRVNSVSKNGKSHGYKIISKKLILNEDGEYIVNYQTYPEITSPQDDLDFLYPLNFEVLVFGLCAYYCLSKGLFDDFKIYHEKYQERAESVKSLKIIDVPMRRWE